MLIIYGWAEVPQWLNIYKTSREVSLLFILFSTFILGKVE